MPEARSVSVVLRALTSQYSAAMARAKQQMVEFGAASKTAGTNWTTLGKKTQNVGREVSRVGSTLTRNVSLPLAALGAGAVKTAIDFESAFTGVRKTIDATEKQYRDLEKGIQAMAERLPASVEEISAVAEAAGQLGIKREAILGFTETMIDLGESTNLTADMAATSLARLANITKMPQNEFERLGSTIVDLGNKGASTEAEITEMALRIAGAGHQVGLSEAQIVGFAESLSSVGIEAQAGGSAISRVFIEMATAVEEGKKDLSTFAEVAGVSAGEFKTAFEDDAAGAMITFIEGLGRMKKDGESVFGVLDELGLSEIRVRDALLRASGAGDLFAESQKTAAEAWKENNALAKESEKRYKTTAAQLEILKNKFRNILARFGKDMMPFLKEAAESLGDLAKWFGSLSEEQRKNILKWGAIAIVAGPVLRIFGGITTAIGTIIRTGGAATTILGKLLGAGKAVPTTVPGVPGVPPAAPVPGGVGAGAAGAAILASAGLAHLADTGIESLHEKLVPEGEGLGHEVANAIFEGVRTGLGGLPVVGTFLKNQDAAADVLADTRTEAEKLADAFTDSAAANKKFLNVAGRAKDITAEQAAKIAILINNAEKFTGGLSELHVQQVGNLLAMGDFKGAMDVIRGSMDATLSKTKRLGGGFDATGANIDEARIKSDRLKASLNAIPSNVTTTITTRRVTQVVGADPNFNKPLPTRASGGPVGAGQSYLIGERGPEILTMGKLSGFVTPNNQIANSNVVHLHLHGPVYGYDDFIGKVERGLRDRAIRMGA